MVQIAPRHYLFSVVIERDEEGYFVYGPSLQGCFTQGDSYEEAISNIDLHVEDRIANHEPFPTHV